jgi:hypothetical protein
MVFFSFQMVLLNNELLAMKENILLLPNILWNAPPMTRPMSTLSVHVEIAAIPPFFNTLYASLIPLFGCGKKMTPNIEKYISNDSSSNSRALK